MKILLVLLVMQTLLSAAPAMQTGVSASPQVLNLWPATPPRPAAKTTGTERYLAKSDGRLTAGRRNIKLGHVSTPQRQVHLPEQAKAHGGTVLVRLGGGFSFLSWVFEGTEVAEWLNSLGFAAIIVKYRGPPVSMARI